MTTPVGTTVKKETTKLMLTLLGVVFSWGIGMPSLKAIVASPAPLCGLGFLLVLNAASALGIDLRFRGANQPADRGGDVVVPESD